MADGGFDPCECIFNHEMAMRRLLSLLRSSQAACTDNECFQDGLPGPGQGDAGQSHAETNAVTYKWSFSAGSDNFMMMMIGWMLMAAMMYFLRPNSMRNNSTEGKPQGEHWHLTSIRLWRLTDGWLFQVQEAMARAPETRLHLWARHPSWVTDLWYYHQCGRHGDFFTHQPFASVILFRLRKNFDGLWINASQIGRMSYILENIMEVFQGKL